MSAKRMFFLTALTIGLLLSSFIIPVRAQEQNQCTFANPVHDGRPLESSIILGMHAVGTGALPGLDGVGAIYPMFPGILAAVGVEGNPSGLQTTYVRIEGIGACEGWVMDVFHLAFAEGLENKIGSLVDENTLLGVESMNGVAPQFRPHWHLPVGFRGALPLYINPTRYAPVIVSDIVGSVVWFDPRDLTDFIKMVEPQVPEQPVQEPINIESQIRLVFWFSLGIVAVYFFVATVIAYKNKKTQTAIKTAAQAQYNSLLQNIVNFLFWFGAFVIVLVVTYIPIWIPEGQVISVTKPIVNEQIKQWAYNARYDDAELLQAFYVQANIPRNSDGEPVLPGKFGKTIPPEVAAAIPAGETTLAPWDGLYDPTTTGSYGQCNAWEEIRRRFPRNLFELLSGLGASQSAQEQYLGLKAIAESPDVQDLGRRVVKEITPENIIGSCGAGALGRTQVMPVHFAPGHMLGDLTNKDIWNDPDVVAEATIRHLFQRGCWGGWYESEDPWSVWCGYNPGAWGKYPNYWDALEQTHARLVSSFPIDARIEISTTSGTYYRTPVAPGFIVEERWMTPTWVVHGSSKAWYQLDEVNSIELYLSFENSLVPYLDGIGLGDVWETWASPTIDRIAMWTQGEKNVMKKTIALVHDSSLAWAHIAYDNETIQKQDMDKEEWLLKKTK